MLDSVIIIGITIGLTELIKPHIPKNAIFIPVLVLAALLSAGNAYFFGEAAALKSAIVDGLRLGAMASGVYGLGKAALGLDK